MNDYGFQEPCCIENSLPILLRKYNLVNWQSNGDVTFDKIMKATAHMAGNLVNIILVVPEIDVPMLRYLRWYQQRGWLRELTILTQHNQEDMILREVLPGSLITCRHHRSVSEGMIIIYGEDATVIVQGSLHSAVQPALENYTTYCGTDGERISMLTAAVTSRLRVLDRKAEKEPTPTFTLEEDSVSAGSASEEEKPADSSSPAVPESEEPATAPEVSPSGDNSQL